MTNNVKVINFIKNNFEPIVDGDNNEYRQEYHLGEVYKVVVWDYKHEFMLTVNYKSHGKEVDMYYVDEDTKEEKSDFIIRMLSRQSEAKWSEF